MRKFPNINLLKEQTNLERLKDQGTIVRITTETPFYFSNPDKIYLVHFGLVDVFYQKRTHQEKILSPRKFLHHAERNQLIGNIGLENTAVERVDLLVVSSSAELIEIDRAVFFEFLSASIADSEIVSLVESWLEEILFSLFKPQAPRNASSLKIGQNYRLEKAQVTFPHDGIVWAEIEQGSCQLGNEQAVFSKNQTLPTTDHLWLTALEETAIQTYTIWEIAQANKLPKALEETIAFLSDVLTLRIEQNFEADKSQLSTRESQEGMAMTNSLQGFANVLEKGKNASVNQDAYNPLVWVFRQLGEALGVPIEVPASLSTHPSPAEAIAQSSGLRMREVILRGNWWKEENGHLLAFNATDDMPYALIQHDGKYIIQNPTTDSEEVTAEIAENLHPKAFMFFRPFDQPITSIGRLWSFATIGLKQDAKLIAFASLAGSIIGLLTPILIGIIMDDVIPLADKDYLLETVGVMVILAFVAGLLTLVQNIFLIRIETKGTLNAQTALMDHLLRLPTTFFKKYSSGDLANRALSINTIRQILSASVLQVALSSAFSVINLALLFYYNSKLAMLGLALAIIAMLVIMLIGYKKLGYNRRMEEIRGRVQSMLFEFISGITKVRISGAEPRIFALWSEQFTKLKTLSVKAVNQHNKMLVFKSGYPLLTNMFFFFFIYYQFEQAGQAVAAETGLPESIAGSLAIKNSGSVGMSVGIFLAFITAFKQFLDTSLKMGEVMIDALNVVPLYERLQPVLAERPASENKAMAKPLLGGIELNHLKFKYDADGNYIINDLSMNIQPDEMVAFVGASGSGKSTIMRLLLGFEKPESGSIYYDGQDFSSLDLASIRSQIGVVLQNSSLMPASIFDNIIGSHDLTLEDAWEAAKLAGLDEDIHQMPMKMNTVLSEGGTTLSGGQRQRLMIARAIVHKPRILFFDEATSALDNHTQRIVTESLAQLQATRIVIAHRLSTVEDADKIFVIDKGKIAEQGNYQELMDKFGLFYDLAKRQMK